MQLKTKFGFVLLVSGLAISAAWSLWTKTRKLAPLDVPVLLAAGESITNEFQLNFDGSYLIEFEAVETVPLGTLHCLMGVQADADGCKEIPPAIRVTWILSSKGQLIQTGTSLEPHTMPAVSAGVARVVGEFQGKAGQEYKLQVTSTADGKSLAPAHPRLKVTVASIAYTDLQSAGVLVFSITFIFVLFAVVLLFLAYFSRQKSNSPGKSSSA